MSEAGWALVATGMYLYALYQAMQGKAAGVIGVVLLGIFASRYGIKNRILKLSLLIGGVLLFAFTYFRFTDSVWVAIIVGLAALGGVFFNDRKEKNSKRGGEA
jgi:hypothetical protein